MDRQASPTTIGKGSKEEESGATDIQKHVKQKKHQKPNGGQQSTPAPGGEEPVAKKDVGKVKKPEVASDRQESTTKTKKESKEEESGATDIQKHVKQKKHQKPHGGQQSTPAPGREEPVAKKDVGKVKKTEFASDRQDSTTKTKKESKEEESGATVIQKHAKQKKHQKPNGGQQTTPAPGGEEPVAKKDVGKVKKPEVASDRQESTKKTKKESKKECR